MLTVRGSHLTEVDEVGAGGSIHAVLSIAGVRAPHLLHPLRKRKRVSEEAEDRSTAEPHQPSATGGSNSCSEFNFWFGRTDLKL